MSNTFKYVAKPVEVEAFPAANLLEGADETVAMPSWAFKAVAAKVIYSHEHEYGTDFACVTKQGPVQINKGDWLIRLADGEIYPCSDEVFKNKYQKIGN